MTESNAVVIALDMGGTWIKGAVAVPGVSTSGFEIARWRNPLDTHTTAEDYAGYIVERCRELAAGRPVCAVVASTAGEVDAAGQRYRIAGAHLKAMATTPWRARAEVELGCPFTLINDAEAFVLGLAENGLLPPDRNMGALVVGTGLGFSVVRQGRWWKPKRRLNFLGSAWSVDGTYDEWGSAVGAASAAGGDLVAFLSEPRYAAQRAAYLEGMARMLASAGILYHLDEVVLGGGLVEAASAAGLDLQQTLGPRLRHLVPPVFEAPRLVLAAAGNRILLQGCLAMALGNAAAEGLRYRGDFRALGTEGSAAAPELEKQSAEEIARHLADAEARAASALVGESPALGRVADRIADAIKAGGRVIYVGAGTSGRIGALDAVEIPCTFGLPEDRFVAVVAGGLADAGLTIESEGEEDVSAVPDLLLLQPGPRDVVVGISASGTAFFVRSALAHARQRGAWTVLVHESEQAGEPVSDDVIRLHSGPESLAGSTRMKAGTATKKVLNILSTTAMIRLGKVRRGRMIDVVASNDKLRRRAEGILSDLTGVSPEEAARTLAAHGYRLRDALTG